MKHHQLRVSLCAGQQLSEEEQHALFGELATEQQQVGPLTVLFGPKGEQSPDLGTAQKLFAQGRINGYGTLTLS